MRTRLALILATLVLLAGALWLSSRSENAPSPFASVRQPEAPEAADSGVHRPAPSLPRARLPEPAPKEETAAALTTGPGGLRRLRDPVSLARAVLLPTLGKQARAPASRGDHLRELQRDLASLADDLRSAAADPSDETLAAARAKLDDARNAASSLFPEPPSPPPAGAPTANPSLMPERQALLRPPRPAPPGVLDRAGQTGDPPEPVATQLRALLGKVDTVLAGSSPHPAALHGVASEIVGALTSDRAGQGPTLRYSAARFGQAVR